jgi:hypothetical protein
MWEELCMNRGTRSVLLIGSAVVAAGALNTSALAQAPAAPVAGAAPAAPATGIPAAQFPTPEFPTCISNAPTDCRTKDGHPNLSGLWAAGAPSVGGGGGVLGSGADTQLFAGRGGTFVGFEADGGLFRESNIDTGDASKPNFPQYKPEYWDQIIDNDYNGNFEDPQQMCLPMGVPRLGAPQGIIALQDSPWVELVYATADSAGIKIRLVPTDGRAHNPVNVAAETWDGDPVGHWEGDTLVIESVGFTDASWLHKNGYVHGFNMKVTERLTRSGNTLTWAATVDDPDYLAQPWNLTPVARQLVTDPNATLYEALPCDDIDHLHVTSHVRSG